MPVVLKKHSQEYAPTYVHQAVCIAFGLRHMLTAAVRIHSFARMHIEFRCSRHGVVRANAGLHSECNMLHTHYIRLAYVLRLDALILMLFAFSTGNSCSGPLFRVC